MWQKFKRKFKMIRIFQRLDNKDLLSALSSLISYAELEQVLARSKKRSDLLSAAALQLGISEHDLLAQLGSTLDLPVLSALDTQIRQALEMDLDLSDWEASGIFPYFCAGELTACICSDPHDLKMSGTLAQSLPVYLSSSALIARAFAVAKQAFTKQQALREVELAESNKALLDRLLSDLLQQARAYGASNLRILKRVDDCIYEFNTTAGQTARGLINAQVSPFLFNELSRSLREQSCLSCLLENGESEKLIIRVISPEEAYQLSWAAGSEQNSQTVADLADRKYLQSILSNVNSLAGSVGTGRILVVEDNQTFIKLLTCFFKKHAIRATFQSSARAALSELERGIDLPQLIVSDLHIPEMDGSEFVQQLKSRPQLADIPVIMLTAAEDLDTELLMLEQGVAVFLPKSSDPRLLLTHIRRFLGQVKENSSKQAVAC